MIVSYKNPDGGVEQVDTDELSAKESADVEFVTELEWSQVETALQAQKPTAMRAILWVFRRRQSPGLRFSEFDVPGWKRRLEAKLGREEVRDLVAALRASEPEGSDDFTEMVEHLLTLADDKADVEWALAETGKAPEPEAEPEPINGLELARTSAGTAG